MICSFYSYAMDVPIDVFQNTYSQNINQYIPKNSNDYELPILKPEYQQTQLKQLYNHYFSSGKQSLSPWSATMVLEVIPLVNSIETKIIGAFSDSNLGAKEHFGENYQQRSLKYWQKIAGNMNFQSLKNITYKQENKAITVINTYARALPDENPDFYHASIAGQGFPFDNLQEAALWAGTPLYVISTTKDKAWSLVLTPDAYVAWVDSNSIAYASNEFINQWQKAAAQNLVAITKTKVSIMDKEQQFQFSGYIGAIYPLFRKNRQSLEILIPFKNQQNQAEAKVATLSNKSATIMPLPASKQNIALIIKQLKNRPYGWGGVFFYNDCSQEIKSLFTPFGIWLPRNTSQQSKLGDPLDLSAANTRERIDHLKSYGHALMTVIFNGGHVMLYVGNEIMSNNETRAITYQNIWGLSPTTSDKRYVIGRSVFFPILQNYLQPEIRSLADKKYFKLIYLDELSSKIPSQKDFVNRFFIL